MRTFTAVEEMRDFVALADAYRSIRQRRPDVPAARALGAIRKMDEGEAANLDEALCPGHEFGCTGTLYGGDDERWGGEGRCLCANCGADGDA